MKILITGAAFIALLSLSITVNAQRIKLTQGDLAALKSETSIDFKFTYENMGVGKYKDEADYVTQKTADYNKKESGKGDTWAKAWVDDRAFRYEPKFIELFIKYSNMTRDPQAKYTIIFNTYFTEPGFNVGVLRQSAKINGTATIVETANPSNVIAVVSIEKAPGGDWSGYDFDTGLRIQESYAEAGKGLAKFIKK